jgi:L-alanine-DL-glutamate epimerase-like enolase superfamily enzyme
MKITGVKTMILKRAIKHPVSDSLHAYDVGRHLITIVLTDEGVTGYGSTYFGRIESDMETVRLILERVLGPVIIGQEPYFVRKVRNEMFVAAEYYGILGVANLPLPQWTAPFGISWQKRRDFPLAKLLSARREVMPAYTMVGWYYEGEDEEFLRKCQEAVEEGFRALKIKVGKGSLKDDIKRIRFIHKEFGDEFWVVVDVNCIFDEIEVTCRGKAYEDEGVYWFEEPM